MYNDLFFSLFLFHSCPLLEKMIINVAFVFNFYCSYKIRAEDVNECNIHCHLLLFLWNKGIRQRWTCLILVFCFFFLALQKTMTTLSIRCPFLQLKKKLNEHRKWKKMMSFPAHYHPLQPKKKNLDVGFS